MCDRAVHAGAVVPAAAAWSAYLLVLGTALRGSAPRTSGGGTGVRGLASLCEGEELVMRRLNKYCGVAWGYGVHPMVRVVLHPP